ncbi:hypothetical protein [Methanolapillus ohkumae]|uniref:hypothetical protein n=1 Tax=Methanolapillus ohkumae TaxID=3028298 RepID=UPI0030B8BF96
MVIISYSSVSSGKSRRRIFLRLLADRRWTAVDGGGRRWTAGGGRRARVMAAHF